MVDDGGSTAEVAAVELLREDAGWLDVPDGGEEEDRIDEGEDEDDDEDAPTPTVQPLRGRVQTPA